MTAVAVVGLVGVALSSTGSSVDGVVTGTMFDSGLALPFDLMATACVGNRRQAQWHGLDRAIHIHISTPTETSAFALLTIDEYGVPGCKPSTRQLFGSMQLAVTQLPLPMGVGHSVTLNEAQGPPVVGGVMTRSADVGLSGVALAMTG